MMKVRYHTLGCKVNQYETEAMAARLAAAGFLKAHDDTPDIIIINSCTVTSESDGKARKLLHRCRREHPNAVIALTGCYPQATPDVAARLPEADIVIGTQNRAALPRMLTEFLMTHQRMVDIAAHEAGADFEETPIASFTERTRAFVKIEDGCDRFCAYCILPQARGAVRSRPLHAIDAEIRSLAASGYREIVLVGINLSAYGEDIGLSLCDAVETAAAVGEIERIRLGSLEPDLIMPENVARLRNCRKLCPQFHLSLQSGCAATLSRMNRRYTPDDYRSAAELLCDAFENAALTTDIMVGFPGETDAEFEESRAFMASIGFARAHIFTYSSRPGTAAANAPCQVPPKVKEARSCELAMVARESQLAFLQSQPGRVFPVLFEQLREGMWAGYTPNYTPVLVKTSEDLQGQILPVLLTEVHHDACIGTLA